MNDGHIMELQWFKNSTPTNIPTTHSFHARREERRWKNRVKPKWWYMSTTMAHKTEGQFARDGNYWTMTLRLWKKTYCVWYGWCATMPLGLLQKGHEKTKEERIEMPMKAEKHSSSSLTMNNEMMVILLCTISKGKKELLSKEAYDGPTSRWFIAQGPGHKSQEELAYLQWHR